MRKRVQQTETLVSMYVLKASEKSRVKNSLSAKKITKYIQIQGAAYIYTYV
jgi:hypothetical protein